MTLVSTVHRLNVANVAGVARIPLNDGRNIPPIGLGVWQIDDANVAGIVTAAIGAGYRLIDTAADYGNEAGVGRGLAQIAVREQFFVTTKVRNEDQGYDRTLRAFDLSMARLGIEAVDLYLIHWPCPQRESYIETWRALIALRRSGLVKSIGVCNFNADHLERIVGETGVAPVVNQIELHPAFQQRELREVHEKYDIVTEAWSPLGRGAGLDNPVIERIARRLRRTPAQVVLRWHVENGIVAIPKTATPARLAENIAVFDFRLSPEDHRAIAGLDRPDGRIGPDPLTYGRERFWRRGLRRLGI